MLAQLALGLLSFPQTPKEPDYYPTRQNTRPDFPICSEQAVYCYPEGQGERPDRPQYDRKSKGAPQPPKKQPSRRPPRVSAIFLPRVPFRNASYNGGDPNTHVSRRSPCPPAHGTARSSRSYYRSGVIEIVADAGREVVVDVACVVNGRLRHTGHGRRPAGAAVCRIPCRILCLADVEPSAPLRWLGLFDLVKPQKRESL